MAKWRIHFAQFLFIANKKQKTLHIRHCHSAINELIGEKSAVKITDDLIDEWPLTDGGKTHMLMDNYMLILIAN